MFPKTSLLLGSSLLWSITPLSACPIKHQKATAPQRLDSAILNHMGEDYVPEPREIDRQSIFEAFDIVVAQRFASAESIDDEAERAFYGLRAMFEKGDRRVITCCEFLDGELIPDPCEFNSNAQLCVNWAVRCRTIMHNHLDLLHEALAEFEGLARKPRLTWS